MAIERSVIDLDGIRCMRITNGTVEVCVTLDMGPRIVKYAFVGKKNVFFINYNKNFVMNGPAYDKYYYKGAYHRFLGGHRLWITPESEPESYYPDNEPVEVTQTESGAVFTAPPQKKNLVQMSLEVSLDKKGSGVKVIHRVKNVGSNVRRCALWGITMMSHNGLEIVPMCTDNTDKLHNRIFNLWAYSDPCDARVHHYKKFVVIKHDPLAKTAFKFGTNGVGNAMYASDDAVFICRFPVDYAKGEYPDGGCSFESFTIGNTTEFETLSDIRDIAPNETSEYEIKWSLKEREDMPCEHDPYEIEEFYNKYIK